jgi:hypothetical protein
LAAQQLRLDAAVVLALAPVAQVAVAEAVRPRRVGEQGDDAVLRLAFGAMDDSTSFHSSTSQCPPFLGPTKRSFSSLTSFAVARSTALNDLPMDDASSARVRSGLAFSAARIFSGVFASVSTGVFYQRFYRLP